MIDCKITRFKKRASGFPEVLFLKRVIRGIFYWARRYTGFITISHSNYTVSLRFSKAGSQIREVLLPVAPVSTTLRQAQYNLTAFIRID